jgi:hypothetical protein
MQNTTTPTPKPLTDEEILARIRARREVEEKNAPLHIPGWVAGVVLLGVVVAGWFWYQGLGVPDIPLCVVNTSAEMPMEIRLDGKRIGMAQRMTSEDPSKAVMGVLKIGTHKLEARDAFKKVIAEESFTVAKGSNGFLWTPLPDPAARFYLEVAYYGQGAGGGASAFAGSAALREFPSWVTQWFKENPKTVVVQKWAKSDFERALRFTRNVKP